VLNDMRVAQPQPMIDATHMGLCPKMRTCVPAAWLAFLNSIKNQPRDAQMNAVNQWANMRPYVEDEANYGVPDYWATPGEFLARGGDCEDYAITKYYSLERLGFSPDDLRIVVVNDTNLNAFHAVLAVRNNGQTWLLDNQINKVVPMDVAVQYMAIYSLNERGWWMHSMPKISVDNVIIAAGGSDNGQ
jgi:predicted transglutaminase-like cysteine proteinase